MRPKPFLYTLLLLVILAPSLDAQGPPGGQPGNLRADVDDLLERVDALERLTAKLQKSQASQGLRIAALELELKASDRTIPTGTVVPFAGPASQVPAGWLLCDGAELDRLAYADLFAVIGTAHGHGDGATTFQLPDYRGMFLRGVDHGRTVDPDRTARGNFPGGHVGDAVGSYQQDTFQRHGHSLGAFGLCDAGTPNGGLFPLVNILAGCRARTVSSLVGGNETRPHNIYVNYIIKE